MSASCLPLAEATKEVAKVEKAVLSTTAKARERQKKKDAEKQSKSGAAASDSKDKAAGKGGTEAGQRSVQLGLSKLMTGYPAAAVRFLASLDTDGAQYACGHLLSVTGLPVCCRLPMQSM